MNLRLSDYNYDVELEFSKYSNNNRTAIELIDTTDGDCVCMATVNLPYELIESDEVAIKDYSENEGVLKFLVDNKIVSEPIRTVAAGYVTFPICKLLVEPK